MRGPVGSGKSVACAVEIFRRACEQAPNAENIRRTRWAVVRNTYAELRLTTIKTWKAWFSSEFGEFYETAPYQHLMKFIIPDGSKVEAEVIFLALDQEKDVKRLLSMDLTGVYFNEIREIAKPNVDGADSRIGRFPMMKDGGATWHGIFADTNPPEEDHWLYKLAERDKPEGWQFFAQPGGVKKVNGEWVANPAAENIPNLPPRYYLNQLPGKSDDWISVYLGAEYGHIATEGSYWAEEIAQAEREGRIGKTVQYDPALLMHSFWDLGVGPNMAVWIGQGSAGSWRWLKYYEGDTGGLPEAAAAFRQMAADGKWQWGEHVWPHDGTARDPGTGQRRCDVWQSLGFQFPVILERGHKGDKIDAARRLIQLSWFDDSGCAEGVAKLRRYKRRKNAVSGVLMEEPLKDGNDHAADAFQSAAGGQAFVGGPIGHSAPYKNLKIDTSWVY
jgi:hypothetical protein